jgi:hypothetical protein
MTNDTKADTSRNITVHRYAGNPVGADIDLGHAKYKFRPNEKGDVICSVPLKDAAKLLAIPGYCEYGDTPPLVERMEKRDDTARTVRQARELKAKRAKAQKRGEKLVKKGKKYEPETIEPLGL